MCGNILLVTGLLILTLGSALHIRNGRDTNGRDTKGFLLFGLMLLCIGSFVLSAK
jgi:hypothetical protein